MFRLRVLSRGLEYSSDILAKCSSQLWAVRLAGNFQRPLKSVGKSDQLEEIRNYLQKQVEPLPGGEWKKLREELLRSSKHILEVNVDATLLGLCNPETQLRVAQSYLDFLQSEGITPNYATIGRILRMYYPAHQKGELLDKDQQDILKIYQKIRQQHEVLDQTTCENLISALIVTPQWKESLHLLDMVKIAAQPTVHAYSMIAAKAFTSPGDMELGWKLLKEIGESGRQPKCEIFIQYLETIRSDPANFLNNLDRFLQFIAEYRITVSKAVVDKLQEVVKTSNFIVSTARIGRNGQCSCCRQYQPNISISTKEFMQLSTSFMDKVLIRKDVFLKSSPEEVDGFVRFIDRTAPYDCIIDGLNVAFSMGTKKPPYVYAKMLASVIKHFKAKGKNILVLGRQHMNKWPQEQMKYIKQNASLFLTSNLSHDDPFLLYAALKSGPKADFVSRDLMRQHAHLLGPELKPVFRRWQQEHQHMVVTVIDSGKVLIKNPIKYELTASRINSTWHIPYKEEYSIAPSDSFEVPESWLCLTPCEG